MTSRPSVYDKGPFLRVPEPFNMAAHTLAAVARSADKVALEVLESPGRVAEAWRFGDLDTAVRGTLTGFRRAGIMPGDRVFLCLGSSVAFPLAFFALAGMGALPVPISPQWTAGELERAARDLHPVAAVGRPVPGARHIPKPALAEWRDLPPGDFAVTRPDDPAYIVFTSGTGGHARAVVHAHRAAWARRMMWRDWMDLRNSDRVLHTGALNWTYTLGTGLTDPWAAGATALIHAGPLAPADWAPLIAAHRPTLFASVPGIYRQILQTAPRADAFTSLRHGLSAGEALHPRIAADWRALTGVPVLEALGMSEVSTYASARPGRPVPVPQRGRRVAVLGTDGAPVASGRIGDLAVSA
ncbi:MAG: AMP-binding protein, partial [Pseudomonadota bacterium]